MVAGVKMWKSFFPFFLSLYSIITISSVYKGQYAGCYYFNSLVLILSIYYKLLSCQCHNWSPYFINLGIFVYKIKVIKNEMQTQLHETQ